MSHTVVTESELLIGRISIGVGIFEGVALFLPFLGIVQNYYPDGPHVFAVLISGLAFVAACSLVPIGIGISQRLSWTAKAIETSFLVWVCSVSLELFNTTIFRTPTLGFRLFLCAVFPAFLFVRGKLEVNKPADVPIPE